MLSRKELITRLASVAVTTVTPFHPDGTVDDRRVTEHARFLVDSGIEVVVPCGNTGEFTSLALDEAKRVTACVTEAIGNKAVVVAGVGWSAPIAIDLARHAKEVGAQAIMVHHPVHTYINRVGLRRYYEQILDAVDIGMLLYKRGPDLTDALISELVRDPRVLGVKYAVSDPNAFANLVSTSNDAEVVWLCGTAERWAPFFWLGGANGFSSGLGNFAPRIAISLLEALRANDYARAMALRSQIVAFEELRQNNNNANNVPAVKEAMATLGLSGRTVRDPLCELDDSEKLSVQQMMQAWELRVPDSVMQ
jgi:4-hydroxy-tetrahydrodipicolinate synthase